ncbi:MAG: Crp/Fnr family transcriptional regulator [Gammaproteobacteria bacterium]|nr:Crp/Fnr family transcriptional regulator [Gammaproteobacteria bacterium]
MTPSVQSLTSIFENLPEKDQNTLFEFAEFLKSRAPESLSTITEPLGILRPEEESVVAAIKRLKKNYPMVSQKALLNETSELMMQHMMQGKASVDVIDELELLFENKFIIETGKTE